MKDERPLTAVGIIPARLASVRLPEKPLALIAGKPLIQHVWENSVKSEKLGKIFVATDSAKIKDLCESFGAEVVMTPPELPSGTDRIAYAYRECGETADLVFNIQGDEPLIRGSLLDLLFDRFSISLGDVGTLVKRITETEEIFDPNIVKVALEIDNTALYFSRSPIPYLRSHPEEEWLSKQAFWKHIGIYAYRAAALEKFTMLPPTDLEISESLEQLRLLQNNFKYACVETDVNLISVDIPEDILKVEEALRK